MIIVTCTFLNADDNANDDDENNDQMTLKMTK